MKDGKKKEVMNGRREGKKIEEQVEGENMNGREKSKEGEKIYKTDGRKKRGMGGIKDGWIDGRKGDRKMDRRIHKRYKWEEVRKRSTEVGRNDGWKDRWVGR